MIVKSENLDKYKLDLIGVEHNKSDTNYVLSYLNNKKPDLVFIEKNPDISLNNYNIQTKKIVGSIKSKNINYECIDTYKYNKNYLLRYDNLDTIQTKNYKSKINQIKELRKNIKKKDVEVYNEIYKKRENEMIKNIKKKDLSTHQISAIIVGEAHIPRLYSILLK